MTTMIRRLLAVCACALVLAACQVDVVVDMTMADDGTGTHHGGGDRRRRRRSRRFRRIADELALDDVVAAGWVVEGPTATPDGGLTISISHPFTSPADATNLLNSIGPPFNQMAVQRTTVNNDTTNDDERPARACRTGSSRSPTTTW